MSYKDQIQQLLAQAWSLRGESNYEESRNFLEQAQKLCQAEDHNSLGRIFHIYMQHEYDQQNFPKALEYNQISITHYTQGQNPDKIAHAARHRADLQSQLNLLDQSEKNYLKAIEIYRSEPDSHRGNLANALRGYALLLEKRKLYQDAIKVWKEVHNIYIDFQILAGVEEATHKIEELNTYLQ